MTLVGWTVALLGAVILTVSLAALGLAIARRGLAGFAAALISAGVGALVGGGALALGLAIARG